MRTIQEGFKNENNTKNAKRWIIAIGLAAVLLALQGCGPTITPAPTPTPLPEKSPPPIRDWNGFTVETICLDAELSFPEWRDKWPPVKLDDATRNILTRMGIQVVNNGSGCDATLHLDVDAKDLCAMYWSGQSCCTGGSVDGLVSLSAEGKKPLGFSISEIEEPARTIDSGRTKCGPGNNDFDDLWGDPLLEGLADIWGPQVFVFGMDIPFVERVERLRAAGLTDEVITALIYALEDENPELREQAAYRFVNFAPQGEAAIPFLIQRLEDEEYSVRRAATEALGNFGPEAEAAVPKLIKMWQSANATGQNESVRKPIADALTKITGKEYR